MPDCGCDGLEAWGTKRFETPLPLPLTLLLIKLYCHVRNVHTHTARDQQVAWLAMNFILFKLIVIVINMRAQLN